MPIFGLDQDAQKVFGGRVTPEMRDEIVEQLPIILQTIAAYWRDSERRLRHR